MSLWFPPIWTLPQSYLYLYVHVVFLKMYISELVEILWTYFVSSLRMAGAKEGLACFSFRTFVLRSIQAKPEKALISLFEACAQETTLPLGSGLLLVWSSPGSGALGTSRTEAGGCAQRCSVFIYRARGWAQICAAGGWVAERTEGSVNSRVFCKSEVPEVRKRKMNIPY